VKIIKRNTRDTNARLRKWQLRPAMIKCPGCDMALSDSDRFCSRCGISMSAAPAAIIQTRVPTQDEVSVRPRPQWRLGMALSRIGLLLLLVTVSWLGYRYYQHQRDEERFARNIRCAQLARDFAQSRTDDDAETTVMYALYSSKRNSCVAALERRFSSRFVVQVADPVTGEVMWVEGCSLPDECNGNMISTMRLDARDAIGKWTDKQLDRPTMPPPH